ncbi:oligosaccharide flippase family protein, partial [Magnetococcales bacterium HHB-1]
MIKNILWNIAGGILGKALGPLLQILVARFLFPDDFGLFALALAVMSFLEMIKELGLTQSIIVCRERFDYISFQWSLQLILAVVLYPLLFFSAPFLAALFKQTPLETMLPLMGLVLFINALGDAITTHLLKAQQYKILAMRRVLMPITTGLVGLLLAYLGAGVYALVFGWLAGFLINTLFLYYHVEQKIHFYWDLTRLITLLKLGKHIVFQRIFGFLVNYADSFFVAKLGAANLGLYRTGHQLTLLLPNIFTTQIKEVIFTD